MLRALVLGLAVLHLGPGLAFALIAFGCEPGDPALGRLCSGNTLHNFLGLTAAAWALMALLIAGRWGLRRLRRPRPAPRP